MSEPTLAQLGAAIRILREERSLSVEALADEANLHWTSISRIERGKQNATWVALSQIAAVFEVEMQELARLAAEQPGTVGR